ncbi:winged helix-turn-helix domain-containing protein [Streptomyces albidoflavus]
MSATASGGDAPAASAADADADGEEPGPDWPADLIHNDDGRPPYVQVADFLRRDIAEGTYPPGSQLPPAREIQERFQVANSTAQNAYRRLKQEGLVYSVKGRGVFVRQAPEPGKHHGPITNYLLREEIAREARAAAADFADLTDEELLAREAELDQRWAAIREEHQRIFNERRKIKRETSRRGLFLPPLHDDDADSDASPRESLPRSRWRTVSTRTTYGDRTVSPSPPGFSGTPRAPATRRARQTRKRTPPTRTWSACSRSS